MTPYGKTPLRGIDDGTNPATVNYKARGEGAAANRKIQIVKVSFDDSDNHQLQRDGNGIVDGVIEPDDMDSVSLEVMVKADSRANAIAEMNLPIKHTVVTLSDIVNNEHAFLNGVWAYHGGGRWEMAANGDEDHKMTIPLKRYRNATGALVALTGSGGILVAQA